MRLNYYRFPESMSNRECFDASSSEDDHFYEDEDYRTVMGCSVTFAKKMLKKYGGYAWTEHCDRDGGVFEVTDIELNKNNSKFKYSHHL